LLQRFLAAGRGSPAFKLEAFCLSFRVRVSASRRVQGRQVEQMWVDREKNPRQE
jgi:hypothetical protein